MKKRVLVFGLLFLILVLPVLMAESNDTSLSENEKVAQARTCLKDKIEEKKCSNLGFEEKVFSVLAVGECEDKLMDDGDGGECWPDSGCNLKATAQAVIALEDSGEDTEDAQEWILDRKIIPSGMTWYLQIESPEETECTISYDGKEHKVTINKEKQISTNAGNCLTLSEGKWWLRISSTESCYEEEFEISCDKRFLTNLLFRKEGSSTLHVSEKTTESSADGTNIEKVESSCLGQSGKCNYEENLWAVMALKYTDNDIDEFLPYLITFSEDGENEKFIPESFLYYLTDSYEFRNSVLLKQKAGKYWDESGDRFYDTALALLPFGDEPEEKTKAKNWLLDNKTRDSEGCWKGSISATGFILYSLWPSAHTSGDSEEPIVEESCEEKAGYCISSISCDEAGGNELNYFCPGMSVCCDKNQVADSCFEQGGEICNSGETCSGGIESESFDLEDGETCCIGGICMIPLEQSDCILAGGSCKISCSEGESEIGQTCDSYSDICCMFQEEEKGYLWLWILSFAILIVLVIIGFLYKDKIRAYWIAISKKKGGLPPKRGGPFLPPSPPAFPMRGIPPRRIVPPSSSTPAKSSFPKKLLLDNLNKQGKDMEEVLKKLKEMGK